MHWFTWLFLFALIAGTAWRVYLSSRQIGAMAQARAAVPTPFDTSIDLSDHQKACDYTAANSRIAIPDTLFDAALLVGWTLLGGFALLDGLWRGLGWSPLWTGVGVIVSALIIMSALSLPFSIYRTFVIEEKFGFNKMTPKMYVVDLIKNFLVSIVLVAVRLAGVDRFFAGHHLGLSGIHRAAVQQIQPAVGRHAQNTY
jgi:STE24 endopeptidase